MRTVIIIFTVLLLLRCNSTENQTSHTIPLNFVVDISPRDTCLRILKTNALKDTFTYQRHYDERTFHDGRISYVRTGPFIYPDRKSGVIIYTPTDSTVAVELYSFDKGVWTLLDRRIDLQQNGLLFYPDYADYNFDGIHDIYINVTVSNGLGLGSGHLLTVTRTGDLVQHPETRDIRDMTPDTASQTINGHKALYCGDSKSVCDEKYKWVDNKLSLVSLPCACADK